MLLNINLKVEEYLIIYRGLDKLGFKKKNILLSVGNYNIEMYKPIVKSNLVRRTDIFR